LPHVSHQACLSFFIYYFCFQIFVFKFYFEKEKAFQQSLLILARSLPGRDLLLSQRNQEITMELAAKLALNQPKIFVRSSLTCESLNNTLAEYSIRDLSTTVGKPCLISPKGFAGASLSKYLDTNFILSPKNLLGKGAEIRTNTISTGIPSPFICQLCYGWSLAQGNLVSIGEAVGLSNE
jgi:hypothetical protein